MSWLFHKKPAMAARIPATFPAKMERRLHKLNGKCQTTNFDVHVQGHFIAPKGKVQFVVTDILVDGWDNMSIRDFWPEEIKNVEKYALDEVYPRIIGQKK